ncbi:hypothetical protein TNIN_199281, partial [Trichonephila inaurata madagascariensis]
TIKRYTVHKCGLETDPLKRNVKVAILKNLICMVNVCKRMITGAIFERNMANEETSEENYMELSNLVL